MKQSNLGSFNTTRFPKLEWVKTGFLRCFIWLHMKKWKIINLCQYLKEEKQVFQENIWS